MTSCGRPPILAEATFPGVRSNSSWPSPNRQRSTRGPGTTGRPTRAAGSASRKRRFARATAIPPSPRRLAPPAWMVRQQQPATLRGGFASHIPRRLRLRRGGSGGLVLV